MENKYKIFVPWKNSIKPKDSFVRLEHYYKNKQYSFKPSKKPFFSLLNEDVTPRAFIEAVKGNNNEDARACLSKSLGGDIDLEVVKKIFKAEYSYKYLIEVSFNGSRGHKVKSVMLTDNNCRYKGIVHFYMIKEPDSLSSWKIFKIVKE